MPASRSFCILLLTKDVDILTMDHRRALGAFGKSEIAKHVYFTGGTLLSYQYLQHRYSLDIDIFSDSLLENELVTRSIASIGKSLGVKVRYTRYPSRWQYFFVFPKNEIKCDIVYFPFPKAGKRIKLKEFNLFGDSLLDIAINKVHACFEREAPRDAFDLYIILLKQNWTFESLLGCVEKKFGILIDPVHLIARLMNSLELLDEIQPLFIGKPPKKNELQKYFKKMSTRYFKKHIH